MGFFGWLKRKNSKQISSDFSQGARNFLDGRNDTLKSVDVDPDGAGKYAGYEKAIALKKAGRLFEAVAILEKSCNSPSIYKGHYRELFRIWRQFNRDDIKGGRYQDVVDRVLTMIRYDDEMIHEMLRYYSIQQKRELPKDHFNGDRNLLISDAKALKKAAQELEQVGNVQIAIELIENLTKKRKVQGSCD